METKRLKGMCGVAVRGGYSKSDRIYCLDRPGPDQKLL